MFNIIALVGNKEDKYEDEEVPEEEAKSYAEEIQANYYLVSANNGDGIDFMFQSLANNYFNMKFMNKINELKEERADSIDLNRANSRIQKNIKICC